MAKTADHNFILLSLNGLRCNAIPSTLSTNGHSAFIDPICATTATRVRAALHSQELKLLRATIQIVRQIITVPRKLSTKGKRHPNLLEGFDGRPNSLVLHRNSVGEAFTPSKLTTTRNLSRTNLLALKLLHRYRYQA